MASPRQYIIGINPGDIEEFLMTALDKKGCEEYIRGHMRVFPNRFSSYKFGQMCDDKSIWEEVKNA